MKAKHFFLAFLSITMGIIGFVAAANYYFDYYGVFHADQPVVKTDILNDRFVKMTHILKNQNYLSYDSFLWGSSRVLKMDTKVTGENTYNLGSPAGMTEDALEQLEILIENGARIKTVYVGLDDFSYYRNYDSVAENLLWISYKDDWKKDIETYSRYLLMPSILKHAVKPNYQSLTYYLGENGTVVIPTQVEKNIEDNVKKHIESPKFSEPRIYSGDEREPEEFYKCLSNLKRIQEVCKEHKINLKIFFNPQHMTTYLADDIELMNRFKKELVKISPFWDFSGVNYVTSNNYFWYETSHPRAFICDKILDTVSGQNQITWVPNFGVYVTEENVDAFCEKAVRDREAYDPNHEQWVPSAEERAVMTKRVNYPW